MYGLKGVRIGSINEYVKMNLQWLMMPKVAVNKYRVCGSTAQDNKAESSKNKSGKQACWD